MVHILSIFLQATGVLFILWVTLGWLVLDGGREGMCVRLCYEGEGSKAERFTRSCLWLRETGLVRMRILLVDCGLAPQERKELEYFAGDRDELLICPLREMTEILEKEAKVVGRTGSAAGNCDRDRISES